MRRLTATAASKARTACCCTFTFWTVYALIYTPTARTHLRNSLYWIVAERPPIIVDSYLMQPHHMCAYRPGALKTFQALLCTSRHGVGDLLWRVFWVNDNRDYSGRAL